MPPPPAEPFATRVLLGPALRTQSDRRLVKLARQGYETAFEEIVRRYRRPLVRFAAGIVGGRSEDVTQDALSKALLALRGSENEIELRPWLYRIVRNTALNELRDSPPNAEQLGETIPGGLSAAAEAERREEMAELVERLRALPEPQRAAIVMRELEGLSHEEIAAALGVSGGAARQTIHRARTALRDGLGMLIPLPFLRMLADHGAEATGGAVAATGVGAASAAAGGGIGAGGAVKAGLAAALIGGAVGTGVAVQKDHDRDSAASAAPPVVTEEAEAPTAAGPSGGSGSNGFAFDDSSGPGGGDNSGREEREGPDDHGGSSGHSGSSGHGNGDDSGSSGSSGSSGPSTSSGSSGEDLSDSSGSGSSGGGEDSGSDSSGSGSSGEDAELEDSSGSGSG